MKNTILLVGHGSRGPDGNRETEEFAEKWRAHQPDLDIRLCHIEFADILLEEGLDLAARGVERVIVVPLIINAAGTTSRPRSRRELPRPAPGTRTWNSSMSHTSGHAIPSSPS